MAKQKGRSRGSRKHGRCKVKCTHYKAVHRREKNKIRKIAKIVRLQPNNKQLFLFLQQLLKT